MPPFWHRFDEQSSFAYIGKYADGGGVSRPNRSRSVEYWTVLAVSISTGCRNLIHRRDDSMRERGEAASRLTVFSSDRSGLIIGFT